MQYNSEELNEILKIFKTEADEIIQELNDGFLVIEKNPQDKSPLKKYKLIYYLKYQVFGKVVSFLFGNH